jgi:nucleotide-binding universal stress UspA family protein
VTEQCGVFLVLVTVPSTLDATERLARSGITERRTDAAFVLCAAPLLSQAMDAMKQAEAVARAVTGELLCLRVPSLRPREGFHGDPSREQSASRAPRVSAARPGESRVLVRRGDFFSVVMETARALRPAMVVIPEMSGQTGRHVRELALGANAPVLLVRNALRTGTVIAASDLADGEFPVLRAAGMLSSSLRARAVFVHNLTPEGSGIAYFHTPRRRCRPVMLDRLKELRLAAESLEVPSESVVTIRGTVEEALSGIARRERADVLVVGTRIEAGGRSSGAALAERLVDESSLSVMVVPRRASPLEPVR